MKYVTILNHGTTNSSSKATSDLVINKLADLLEGKEGRDWILNEGAGTDELFARNDVGKGRTGLVSKALNAVTGIAAGKGVEKNVARAVQFVRDQLIAFGARSGGITANLAGHSRGSITCYKIARALRYKNIALGGNIAQSFLMLAESEHRLAFRPYVDALYSMGLEDHKFDTIPGTHGGINELAGSEKEAASIVMSRAVEFLHEHQTPFKTWFAMWVLGGPAKLETYAKLMRKIKKYQWHASLLNPGNFISGGGQVELQRIAVVHGPKTAWGQHEHPRPGQSGCDRRPEEAGRSPWTETERSAGKNVAGGSDGTLHSPQSVLRQPGTSNSLRPALSGTD